MVNDKVKVKAVPCEIWSRIVGYYRPVQGWNDGKKEEFKDREYISLARDKVSGVIVGRD